MGARRSTVKNKKSNRPAAAIAVKRDSVLKNAARAQGRRGGGRARQAPRSG